MGASRKLQGEIDRVLKKVQEGVDVFDSIWNKVYDTDNANQKEKFEADLKKEIKKLQRYRDQIKTWIQSSEIKDKKVSASYEQALVDARKLIEREMERFKICEKETKTKAFSKEGLGQQPKTDPKEKAKSETRDWINNVVGELENQIDMFEAVIEGLTVKKGKTRPPRLVHLETSIARHKSHIMKLELILRLLDNEELSPEQVNDVKDFLDNYVERNQEDFDEFSDVDELYSSLPLDKVESPEELVTMGPSSLLKATHLSLKTSLASTATSTTSPQHSTSVQEQNEETTNSEDVNNDINTVVGTPPSKSSAMASAASTPTGARNTSILSNVPSLNMSPASSPSNPSARGILEIAGAASSAADLSTSSKEEENVTLPGCKPSPSLTGLGGGALPSQSSASVPITSVGPLSTKGSVGSVPSVSDVAKKNVLVADDRVVSGGTAQPLVSPLSNRMILPQAGKATDGSGLVDSGTSSDNATVAGRVFLPPVASGTQWRPGSSFNQNEALEEPQEEQNMAEDSTTESGTRPSIGEVSLNEDDTKSSHSLDVAAGLSGEPTKIRRDTDLSPGQPFQSMQTSGSLGVIGRRSRSASDLGAMGDNLGVPTASAGPTHDRQMLETAYHKLPQPKDSKRAKPYFPKHPASTPSSYPRVQAPIVNHPAFWDRFASDRCGAETLFFAFYYQQNTYQQYSAAKALKKKSWRYHKMYNTWFQRHEEPKVTTDEYEQGTYVYFDIHIANDNDLQHGWCQRIKTEFTFEYNYLEDELIT